jgi:hypothetical protein
MAIDTNDRMKQHSVRQTEGVIEEEISEVLDQIED